VLHDILYDIASYGRKSHNPSDDHKHTFTHTRTYTYSLSRSLSHTHKHTHAHTHTQEYAVRKMDGVNLEGSRISVEFAKEAPSRGGGGGRGGDGFRLTAEGLSAYTSWQDLKVARSRSRSRSCTLARALSITYCAYVHNFKVNLAHFLTS